MLELTGRPLRNTRRDRALFVNRDEVIGPASTTARNGGNVLIVGPRGSGKSSVLRMLAHELSEQGVACSGVVDGRGADSVLDFLTLVRAELNAWERIHIDDLHEREMDEEPWREVVTLRPELTDAQRLLGQLREMGRSLPQGDRRVVLVDEMPSPQVAHTLFGRMRDELWELPLVWIVCADQREAGVYREPPADAFWQRVVEIPDLSDVAAAELLLRRLGDTELAETTLDGLVRAASGNPRRLISLAHEVVVDGGSTADVLDREAERNEVIASLSQPAQRLLAEVTANGAASPSDQGLLLRLGWGRSRASQVFGELESQGLVRPFERPGSGGRPRRVYELV